MLGWSITIFDLTPEACQEYYLHGRPESAVLARWQVSLGGLFWLERLIEQGKAIHVSGSSFPNRYLIAASHIQTLRLLEDIRPRFTLVRPEAGVIENQNSSQGSGWINQMQMYPERLAQCSAQTMLTIDAWDLI